jgi:hypothetical protein
VGIEGNGTVFVDDLPFACTPLKDGGGAQAGLHGAVILGQIGEAPDPVGGGSVVGAKDGELLRAMPK